MQVDSMSLASSGSSATTGSSSKSDEAATGDGKVSGSMDGESGGRDERSDLLSAIREGKHQWDYTLRLLLSNLLRSVFI